MAAQVTGDALAPHSLYERAVHTCEHQILPHSMISVGVLYAIVFIAAATLAGISNGIPGGFGSLGYSGLGKATLALGAIALTPVAVGLALSILYGIGEGCCYVGRKISAKYLLQT